MTDRFARKVDEVLSRIAQDLPDLGDDDPVPACITAAFMPSPRERDEISLYRVGSTSDLHAVAVALEVGRERSDVGATYWLVTDAERLDALGAEYNLAAGDTANTRVNQLHLNVKIPSADFAESVARAFLSGDVKIVEKKQASHQLEMSVRNNEFQLRAPSEGAARGYPFRHIPVWIARGWVTASAVESVTG